MLYDYKNKERATKERIDYLLSKTLSMFAYAGLEIPCIEIERQLQTKGFTFIFEYEGRLIANSGNLGGELDEYGEYTQININIPFLKISKTFDISEGVLIKNDVQKIGLYPLFNRVSYMLAENDINFILQGFSSRSNKIISASDDKTKKSAEEFIKQSVAGELAIIGSNPFFEGVNMHTASTNQTQVMTSLIQYAQFLKSILFNEIGITTNEDMHKKANLLQEEVNKNDEFVYPLIFNMFDCRKAGIEAINKKFNKNASVSFSSIWGKKYGTEQKKEFTKMLLSEKMQDVSLWGAIKNAVSAGMGIQENPPYKSLFELLEQYGTDKLDRQTILLHGEKELYSKFNDVEISELAELLYLTHGQKWEKLPAFGNVEILEHSKEIVTTENTETVTDEKVNKISVDDAETLIDESGASNEEVTAGTETETKTKQDFSDVSKSLTQSEKLSIVNIIIDDTVNFLTLSIYTQSQSEEL